ncbi:MAG: hypothetical protein JWO94_3939 [Verrucomicrobiaceae bacterium]|nr:hypothetical protein [Verrucomicrobiaceae bacterium]
MEGRERKKRRMKSKKAGGPPLLHASGGVECAAGFFDALECRAERRACLPLLVTGRPRYNRRSSSTSIALIFHSPLTGTTVRRAL